jgi:hypothetical protein
MYGLLGNFIQICAIGLVLALCQSCTEPCLELSTRLCKCEDTDSAKQICVQTKNQAASNRETNDNEQEACIELLDQKDCAEESICSNRDACGLSQPNGNAG